LKSSSSTWALLAIAIVTLITDQITKFWVVTRLAPRGVWAPIPALSNFFTIEYTTNTGAAFGLFKDWGPIFVGVAVVVIAAIMIYQRQVPQEEWLVRLALGLQLGGAFGNLTDRLRLGHVVDFIYFHFWPLFNVADSAIVVGVVLLALTMLREGRNDSSTPVPKSNESADSNPPASA
jgi:signal peptidase II